MDGDSPGKEFEAYAQLLPRALLDEVAMDFWATRGNGELEGHYWSISFLDGRRARTLTIDCIALLLIKNFMRIQASMQRSNRMAYPV